MDLFSPVVHTWSQYMVSQWYDWVKCNEKYLKRNRKTQQEEQLSVKPFFKKIVINPLMLAATKNRLTILIRSFKLNAEL